MARAICQWQASAMVMLDAPGSYQFLPFWPMASAKLQPRVSGRSKLPVCVPLKVLFNSPFCMALKKSKENTKSLDFDDTHEEEERNS